MSHYFLLANCIGLCLIILTSSIKYEVLRQTWNILPRMQGHPQWRIMLVLGVAFVNHITDIWVYGVAYWGLGQYEQLGYLHHPGSQEATTVAFVDALYFSAITYSSLGYGDIIPTGPIRWVAAAEVLNGLVLIGWSVSFTYLVMLKFWDLPHRRDK